MPKKLNLVKQNIIITYKIGKGISRLVILKLKKKKNLYHHKSLTFSENVDIGEVLVSNKISFNAKNCKYFTGSSYNSYKVKPLHIMLPKTSTYVKGYVEKTKLMYFLTEDDDLLETYNTIWDKIS